MYRKSFGKEQNMGSSVEPGLPKIVVMPKERRSSITASRTVVDRVALIAAPPHKRLGFLLIGDVEPYAAQAGLEYERGHSQLCRPRTAEPVARPIPDWALV